MDVNYLFYRQQVERSRAESAACDAARRAHAELAQLYEGAIARHRSAKDAMVPGQLTRLLAL